ncbi:HD family phosphohydrolase [Cuneatibacter sp. NSJ-177]|uniref:HD domain-containing protein n=1 Tax=Cuneatibacter sp. NSJ-177 TaxID=2931401 RepID=UPI001FD22E2B|nr:HD domain-containing protein [Cuneatibacter sp. NSJ-177]MCJ7833993.1 HD family phosphohydrolase [Cuneatibacter sp. NSJ-177]
MKLSDQEMRHFVSCVRELRHSAPVQEMRAYRQHGATTTYDHCIRVAYASYFLAARLHLSVDWERLVRGAILHDLYLYDWHEKKSGRPRLHGFRHPGVALQNARRHYQLSPLEEDIIQNHMWPLTIRSLPKSREAAIVCLTDKICSLAETVRRKEGGNRRK